MIVQRLQLLGAIGMLSFGRALGCYASMPCEFSAQCVTPLGRGGSSGIGDASLGSQSAGSGLGSGDPFAAGREASGSDGGANSAGGATGHEGEATGSAGGAAGTGGGSGGREEEPCDGRKSPEEDK